MWESELEAGILWVPREFVDRLAGVLSGTPPAEGRPPGRRLLVAGALTPLGLGVVSVEEGRRVFLAAPTAGVLRDAPSAFLGRAADASDAEGEGGSCSSETVSAVERDLVSGGVVMSGELAVDWGEASTFLSKVGDPITDMSVEMVDKWRDSCFLILSWSSSASILRSDSSSRNRCDSIRSFSRSCSPILISSSIMTPRSMAWLYLDSMSSSDDVVLRACRS